jgi:nitrite reductase/ring-hydroxylating ferredoxin subunit
MKEYLLGKIEDIPDGKGRAFQAGTRTVAVFRSNGRIYAIANRCVHKGARYARVICRRRQGGPLPVAQLVVRSRHRRALPDRRKSFEPTK